MTTKTVVGELQLSSQNIVISLKKKAINST